ncbi:MFS general substrate transporter [Penicillium cinerascens]|uniref:MFS general substrate transporter n=1 Tax=Penicillium cinerascens TaxID=70096 RepID=A0A9W9N9E7_9EURO|nr:MFS general substrate transporter [Penicillium cinerascens]KAJ5215715.1 MFS general substrate transporter [Penicillium cinerascens]
MYGRVRILQLGNLIYLIFNITGSFSQSTAQIIIFRFLGGFGGSGPLVRWTFYIMSIINGLVGIFSVFFLRETYELYLLKLKA